MSEQPNGTKEKDRTRPTGHERNSDNPSSRVGSFQAEGRQFGNDEIGFNQSDSYGKSTHSTPKEQSGGGKQERVGKILKRLKVIEEAYESYVDAHQQRLETRLEESREKRKQFQNEVQLLEAEILDLLAEDSSEND